MADRPILFSAPMVRALLAGNKTQTRRVARVQSDVELIDGMGGSARGDLVRYRYAHGDRLWVREAWCSHQAYDTDKPSDMGGDEPVGYIADGTWQTWGWPPVEIPGRYRAAMHMPRWASRLTLTITELRVQRLHDITEADALAEGVGSLTVTTPKLGLASITAIEGYRDLWNSLHGDGAWDANPWVAAISFTVQHGNIDNLAGVANV